MDLENSMSLEKSVVDDLLKYFHEHVADQKKNRWKVEKALQEDETMKLLDAKLKEHRGFGVLEEFKRNETPLFNEKIQAVLDQQTDVQKPYLSVLIGCAINVSTGSVEVETARWGEHIVKGGGVQPDAVKSDMAATFEFGTRPKQNKTQANGNNHMLECAIMGATILDYAKEKELIGIGGKVAICMISDRGTMISGDGFQFEGEEISAVINDKRVQMSPFYKKLGRGGLI